MIFNIELPTLALAKLNFLSFTELGTLLIKENILLILIAKNILSDYYDDYLVNIIFL